jgi:hypothetical protein
VADELNTFPFEGAISVDVIGVRVGIDHITDGSVGALADGASERFALGRRSTRVDHGNAGVTDHKADVGNFSPIGGVRDGMNPLMNKEARGDFLQRQGGLCNAPIAEAQRQKQNTLSQSGGVHAWVGG